MSRHQAVKNLDLDDELDDFDGADYDDEEYGEPELSAEDKEQLRRKTIEVRQVLDDGLSVTDAEIQDSLWYTYYDVEKTVNFLISSKMPKENKVKKVSFQQEPLPPSSITTPRIPRDFWHDMSWMNTPVERHAILIPPPQSKGGLLGGSSEPPKMSKLQALAAARKKKAQEQKESTVEGIQAPMDKLAITSLDGVKEATSQASIPPPAPSSSYAERKRKNLEPHPPTPQPSESVSQDIPTTQANPPPTNLLSQPEIVRASPSAFANTMFGHYNSRPTSIPLALPYLHSAIQNSTDAFAGPSPDDVVIAAQSKAKSKSSKPPAKANGDKKVDQVAVGVEAIKIDTTPKVTSKNLDVLAEFGKSNSKNAANFVVIGHVDAGKSTLMGRLLLDLNVIDQRTIDKYRKEAESLGKSSFALAWVLDQGSEERARGVTIDVAVNKFETDKTAFTILDAPGHKDFIPNMIAGASNADFAVLVIDASRGSFESGLKGQTKEHALLVRSMGVQRIIIAINKLDTVAWSQDRFEEISQQLSAFLLAAGFQQRNISFIPLSGLHGDNILNKITSPDADWYTGHTLIEELDRNEPFQRALDKPLRFTINDIFKSGVQNPLSVSGRLESGSLQVGEPLLALPSSTPTSIKSIETTSGEPVDWAVAGQNITINLPAIADPNPLKIGDILCSPSTPIACINAFTAKVLAFEYLIPGDIDVHRGHLHIAARIIEFEATLDKVSGKVLKKKPRVVKPGDVARVVVKCENIVPLEKGMRVVFRSGGVTIGAGLLE